MIVAAVIYFVSPFDLIPDSIPVLGLIDDATVVTYVAKANLSLISSFRTWEILLTSHYRKQPCECSHGKSFHQSRRVDEKKFHSPCRFLGCDCRDYKPKKT